MLRPYSTQIPVKLLIDLYFSDRRIPLYQKPVVGARCSCKSCLHKCQDQIAAQPSLQVRIWTWWTAIKLSSFICNQNFHSPIAPFIALLLPHSLPSMHPPLPPIPSIGFRQDGHSSRSCIFHRLSSHHDPPRNQWLSFTPTHHSVQLSTQSCLITIHCAQSIWQDTTDYGSTLTTQ